MTTRGVSVNVIFYIKLVKYRRHGERRGVVRKRIDARWTSDYPNAHGSKTYYPRDIHPKRRREFGL